MLAVIGKALLGLVFFNEKNENIKKRILRELHEKGSFKGLKERYLIL